VSVERNVETLLVVDPSMMEYYKNEDIENYVLTIMNMVQRSHSAIFTARCISTSAVLGSRNSVRLSVILVPCDKKKDATADI